MPGEPRVLLVEDDPELCAMLEEYLVRESFVVQVVRDGGSALAALAPGSHDLVVLDVMLPVKSGLDVLREMRGTLDVPVIMLTARGDEIDRVVGLELGADDYLPKPFNPRELVARLRAIWRRTQQPARTRAALLVRGGLRLDPARREASWEGRSLELTSAEMRLLEMLMRHAGEVVTRDELSEEVLGRRLLPPDRSIDTHVSHVRKKLALAQATAGIASVRGAGYQLVLE